MTKAKTPRPSNRRSSKCPGKHKTLAASDNAPAGKAACPGESILRATHIPDGLLCVCGHAPTAGTLLASLRAHNISAGEGRSKGTVSATRQVVSRPRQPGEAFGAAEALRESFHVERAQTRRHLLHFTPQGAGLGTRIQVLTNQQYCLFRLFCIFRIYSAGPRWALMKGHFMPPGAIKGAPEACTAGRRATPHQKRKTNRTLRQGRHLKIPRSTRRTVAGIAQITLVAIARTAFGLAGLRGWRGRFFAVVIVDRGGGVVGSIINVLLDIFDALFEFDDGLAHAASDLRKARPKKQESYNPDDDDFRSTR